jgi:hypothetical protein
VGAAETATPILSGAREAHDMQNWKFGGVQMQKEYFSD